MYRVIGSPRTRTIRVLWLLEELGLEYEHDPAPPRSDTAVAHNASGKVPALVTEGETITDSTAILTYLADRHGAFTHPAGTLDRARQDSLTHFILDEFDSILWTAARHSFILPEDMRLPAIKDSLRWEFGRSVARLGDRLREAEFLAGPQPTIPDLLAAHCARWAGFAEFPVEDERVIAHRDRMLARPAFARATSN